MKDFVLYPEALELKELGFDEPCFGKWLSSLQSNWKDYTLILEMGMNEEFEDNRNVYLLQGACSAPTYSQAFRWFREKYSWQHSIDATSDQHRFELGYNYWIWNNKTGEEHHTMPKNRPTGDWEYETYEEAELACLEKLIELVKK
jgi:hypothetical protein